MEFTADAGHRKHAMKRAIWSKAFFQKYECVLYVIPICVLAEIVFSLNEMPKNCIFSKNNPLSFVSIYRDNVSVFELKSKFEI